MVLLKNLQMLLLSSILDLNKTIFPTGNSGVWHLLNVQLNTSGQVKSSASLPYILYCWLGFTFPQVSLPRPKGKWWNTLHNYGSNAVLLDRPPAGLIVTGDFNEMKINIL